MSSLLILRMRHLHLHQPFLGMHFRGQSTLLLQQELHHLLTLDNSLLHLRDHLKGRL